MAGREQLDPTRLTMAQLVTLLKKGGFKAATEEHVESHVALGFPLNADGTIDVYDYATWLVGVPFDHPVERTPPDRPIDITSVNPTELAGWLTLYNHIGYEVKRGRITTMFQKYHFRMRALMNEKNINFVRFLGFNSMHYKPPRVGPSKSTSASGYEQHRDDMARRNAAASAAGRDIGEIPEVDNPERKERCERDFRLFCETYFQQTFSLEWSQDHLRAIEKIEQSTLYGGLFALAMSRGSGKSSMCETAAIWSMLYGHREFVCLIGATETAAEEMLDSIKVELETNELLLKDFPEVCFPVKSLEGIANRCAGQTCGGVRTRITWTSNELILPTIEGSPASGIVVRVAGITGRIRGMKYKRPDGRTVRPTLVIVDDPQTRESAGSIEQNRKRVATLAGDILGLAGPGQKMSGFMPCTVIKPGDMADQILDRQKHPEWNGEKAKMLYKLPDNMKLWEEYSTIRAESLREEGNFARATEFYREHREEMDKGAVVGWESRYNHDELSALQNAMNLLFTDEVAFAAEYQNEPLAESGDGDEIMSSNEIAAKVNGIPFGKVPLSCTRLTMFVDVQKTALFYTICAWGDDFTGVVMDYGAWPKQADRMFTLAHAHPTIQDIFPKGGFEGQLFSALKSLFKEQMDERVFVREDGAEMRIDMAAIDANWAESTDVVYEFCRQPQRHGKVMPSHGRYVGASSKPMSEYRKHTGDRIGLNWIIPSILGKRTIRHVTFDTNFWKSFVHSRLATTMGDHGCLSLYGERPYWHENYALHMTAEYRIKTEGRGRTVYEWKLRPERSDNHWLDCTVGCAVLASVLGSALPENMGRKVVRQQTVRLSELAQTHTPNTEESESEPQQAHTVRSLQRPAAIRLSDMLREKRGW